MAGYSICCFGNGTGRLVARRGISVTARTRSAKGGAGGRRGTSAVSLAVTDIILSPQTAHLADTLKPRPPQPNWPEVLIEWAVIEGLEAAGWPERLELPGAAKAALVSEVSAYLRFRTIEFRELEAEARMAAASEAVYENAGRLDYRAVRDCCETAQAAYLVSLSRSCGRNEAPTHNLSLELHQREATLGEFRRPSIALAGKNARAAAAAYWQAVARCRIPEGFFADAPAKGAITILRAHRDLWWALFLKSLRAAFNRSDPAYCRLLEALPALWEAAAKPGQKFVLTALVQEWRRAHGERFGLLKDIHFPVVEQRAWAKHRKVSAWFERHAAGYKSDIAVRENAARTLYREINRALFDRLPTYGNN